VLIQTEAELNESLEHAEQNVGVYKALEKKDPGYRMQSAFWRGAVWAIKKALGRPIE
jgi:hypothetical protein